MRQERFISGQKSKPTLPTGEEFYTNMPKDGYKRHGSEHITLDQYIAELREKFPSVVVMPLAVDSNGRRLENDVAIFVKQ